MQGVQGVHLNPLGLFLRTSTPRIWGTLEHPECLPTGLSPLAERTCFSQALTDDLIFSYYAEGLCGGLYGRPHNAILSSPRRAVSGVPLLPDHPDRAQRRRRQRPEVRPQAARTC